jgi:hypothetical protein
MVQCSSWLQSLQLSFKYIYLSAATVSPQLVTFPNFIVRQFCQFITFISLMLVLYFSNANP